MTVKRLFAILFIFGCTTVAWFVLGGSVLARTGEADATMNESVAGLWGGVHSQPAPRLGYQRIRTVFETVSETDEEGREQSREVPRKVVDRVAIPIEATRLAVNLALEHRRKGLLWHDTYEVLLDGAFHATAPADLEGPVQIAFSFPSAQAIYDGFVLKVNGEEVEAIGGIENDVPASARVQPGETVVIEVAYLSRGLDRWLYRPVEEGVGSVRDFQLEVTTDFDEIDFPSGTLSPSGKEPSADGWKLEWTFDHLVSGKSIGVDLPNRVNPGPLTARITFFAPVSLLFFITVLVLLDVLGRIALHPAHFFFLSAAFFAFHLLLAYLVDHMSVHVAFAIASAVSIGLVVSYLRLVCGLRRALLHAGVAQLIYLVLLSYSFFFEGYAGLTVTAGAVVTLFVLMQLTGRVDWSSVFGGSQEVASTG